MTEKPNNPRHNLEEQAFKFAKSVRLFAKKLNLSISNIEDAERLIRSSGSVGVNLIEANKSSSKKVYLSCIEICRKEAKESAYWLKLIGEVNGNEVEIETKKLHREAIQLTKIFSSIILASK